MGIIKIYNDKKWTLQFLDALYNSIDVEDNKSVSFSDITIYKQIIN
jgi:hypothetical protein